MRLGWLLLSILALIVLFSTTAEAAKKPAKIAIIIDDMGNSRADLDAALLPGRLTFAVLPFTPHGRAFALRAHHQGKQIMLHAPMQAVRGNRLGPGALTTEMSLPEIKLELQRALDNIPYVAGVNNHMGSYFTQVEDAMQAVMETLQHRQLFFIDSRTSEFSVAEQAALDFGVPTAHRHVFLDNDITPEYLEQQWQLLLDAALSQGHAVGIGHPYPETLAFLKQQIPRSKQQGIALVFASELTTTQPGLLPRRVFQVSE